VFERAQKERIIIRERQMKGMKKEREELVPFFRIHMFQKSEIFSVFFEKLNIFGQNFLIFFIFKWCI
jgi:hypothetical protein